MATDIDALIQQREVARAEVARLTKLIEAARQDRRNERAAESAQQDADTPTTSERAIEAFRLRYCDDLTLSDVAAKCGYSKSYIVQVINRGERILRNRRDHPLHALAKSKEAARTAQLRAFEEEAAARVRASPDDCLLESVLSARAQFNNCRGMGLLTVGDLRRVVPPKDVDMPDWFKAARRAVGVVD